MLLNAKNPFPLIPFIWFLMPHKRRNQISFYQISTNSSCFWYMFLWYHRKVLSWVGVCCAELQISTMIFEGIHTEIYWYLMQEINCVQFLNPVLKLILPTAKVVKLLSMLYLFLENVSKIDTPIEPDFHTPEITTTPDSIKYSLQLWTVD